MTKNNERVAHDVLRLRLSQMIVNEEYKASKFKIPIHLAFGHEAIAVAVSHIMKEEDRLILSHRNIAYNLARHGSLRPILDEYFLKSSGLMGGKLGSMNLINPEKGILYSSSILGNNFSVAVGVSMAQKISSDKGITIVLGGDGAIEEGSFHESLLMFKSLNLSALVVIENNEWSMSTHIKERRCPINLAKLAESFDIKYTKLSGNDPYEYIEELRKLREYSLINNTPVCIEVAVTTFGDWIMETPEFPNGKFINYHAGPAPKINLQDWPLVIKTTNEDPVFVLNKYFKENILEKISKSIREELNKELT